LFTNRAIAFSSFTAYSKPNMRDSELWEGSQNGDKSSYERLFKFYYPFLFNYGLKHTADKCFLEDCIQELFLEIWEKANEKNIKSFKAYIFQTFRNKLYRYFDRNKRISITTFTGIMHQSFFELSKEDFIIENEIEREKLSSLYQSISRLSKKQQEIIYLRFNLNLSYEEISSIMGISYQVSRNLLYQAIKKLKKSLHLIQFGSVFLNFCSIV
jgi:RNA polymerase sigma factor, sigma-70 family